jgi:hypothetical protein
LLSFKHFDVYVGFTFHPIEVLTRWALMLQEYNLIIKLIKGKNNVIADAMSRTE